MERGKSPKRGEVYLLSTEENEAYGALQENLQHILVRYNESFDRANVRLVPAGPTDRDRDYYIFPFFCDEIHSLGFLEHHIQSELAEALDGRSVQIRCIRDRANGDTRFYIDISTRKRQPTSEKKTGMALKEFVIFIVLGILSLIAMHQFSKRD